MNIKHLSLLSLLTLVNLPTIASDVSKIADAAIAQSENTSKPLSVRELIRERKNDAEIEANYSREKHEFFKYQHYFRLQETTFYAIGECMDKDIQADNVPAMNYCYSEWKSKLKELAKEARINKLDESSAHYRLFRNINKENKEEEAKAFNTVEQKLETIRTLIAQQQKAQ